MKIVVVERVSHWILLYPVFILFWRIATLSFYDNSKEYKEWKKNHSHNFNFVVNWYRAWISIKMRLWTMLEYHTEISNTSKLWKRLKLCDKYIPFKMYFNRTKRLFFRLCVFFVFLGFMIKSEIVGGKYTKAYTIRRRSQVNFVCFFSLYRSPVLITSSSSTNWNRNFVCESPFFHYFRAAK